MVAPSPDMIWRENSMGIITAYDNWSNGVTIDKVTIVNDIRAWIDHKNGDGYRMRELWRAAGRFDRVCMIKDGRYDGTKR